MSASRDDSQKIGFCYSNVYSIFKNKKPSKVKIHSFEPKKPTNFEELKKNLEELGQLNAELKEMIDALERLVK